MNFKYNNEMGFEELSTIHDALSSCPLDKMPDK